MINSKQNIQITTNRYEVLFTSKARTDFYGRWNQGLRVRDINTGEVSWINNYRTDRVKVTKGDVISVAFPGGREVINVLTDDF